METESKQLLQIKQIICILACYAERCYILFLLVFRKWLKYSWERYNKYNTSRDRAHWPVLIPLTNMEVYRTLKKLVLRIELMFYLC